MNDGKQQQISDFQVDPDILLNSFRYSQIRFQELAHKNTVTLGESFPQETTVTNKLLTESLRFTPKMERELQFLYLQHKNH